MSDQFDPALIEAARAIAARCDAIRLCVTCDHTWTTAQYDEDSVAALVLAAKRVVAEDEDLDRFEDDGGLRRALVVVLSAASAEKGCAHE